MLNSLGTSTTVADTSVPHRLHILYAGQRRPAGHLCVWADHAGPQPGSAPICPPAPRASPHGTADLVPVDALAPAHPDLVEPLRSDAPLNTPDPATLYGGGAVGHTDYPTHTARGTQP
ncbi:hypothetical protein [Streptomyces sp. NBC_00280]|uniref:hypothetical protein n=1 Tax=Streptomyces sp. NBC_00280 TaxID=2975699 RepID=UPI003249D371